MTEVLRLGAISNVVAMPLSCLATRKLRTVSHQRSTDSYPALALPQQLEN